MQTVEETKAALAKELEDDALREQGSLPQSDESKPPEVSPPKAKSDQEQVGSSASPELALGSDPCTSRRKASSPPIPTSRTKSPKSS